MSMDEPAQEWPAYWLYYIRAEIKAQNEPIATTDSKGETKVSHGSVRYDCGAGVKFLKGTLMYSCPCGSTFQRIPEDKNQEARAWVVEHTPHIGELTNASV